MKNYGPYKIKKSLSKYQNPWIKVREDQVVHLNGKAGIFGVVEMKNGVTVLAMDKTGFVYLTREFHYAIGKNIFELVSGGIEKNETPLDSAKRELAEELGIKAKNWKSFGQTDPFTTVVKSTSHLFLATELSFGKSNQEEVENVKMVKMKFGKVVEMVMDSQITHAPSALLVLKVKESLERKS